MNYRFLNLQSLVVILTLCVSVHVFGEKKIDYKIVGESDFSYPGCVRKEFKVIIQEGLTKEEIQKIAELVHTQKKETIPDLEEAQISFFYPDLNINKDIPNAVANWNIGSSEKWEFHYPSLRIKQPEAIKKTDDITLKRREFRKGIFITYDLIISSVISDKEADKKLRDTLEDLKKEWQNNIEWLGVNLYLSNNYLPFMKGEWVSVKSKRPKKGVIIEIDEDGRHQTEDQTKVLSSEETRRKIFYEIVQSEDTAQKEADRIYPTDPAQSTQWQENIIKNINKSRELKEKYNGELLKKYGLIKKHLTKIGIEGVTKGWPMP